MKTLKIIILLATISLFTSIPYDAAKARDCSDPKGFHEKMMCKISGDSVSSDKPKKKGKNFWEKIKNIGKKNTDGAG
tara:strand:+ start:242 stop:472 length:231 start_codon:yes stop_codon:yes gene_type:complete